jgi:hypothetical protein
VQSSIARNFELFDQALGNVRRDLERPEFAGAGPLLREALLHDSAMSVAHLGWIRVLDERGNPVLASSPEGLVGNQADRDFFRHHRASASEDLRIGEPFAAPGSDEHMITLSRRLYQADGSFAGVVVGTMNLSYFGKMFSRLKLGRRDSINLLRSDGILLARRPSALGDVGRSLAAGEPYRLMHRDRTGAFVARASLDRIERFYTYAHLDRFPILVNVALAVDDIFYDWWRKAVVIGPVVAVLCLITILLTALVHRELRHRTEAERRVLAANAELAELAVTDPLTGLFNRRRFDEVMWREWRRSQRTGSPLSLVLLDADSFKSYNDVYGHQAGDEVLKVIAESMAGSVRRSADLAAVSAARNLRSSCRTRTRRGQSGWLKR